MEIKYPDLLVDPKSQEKTREMMINKRNIGDKVYMIITATQMRNRYHPGRFKTPYPVEPIERTICQIVMSGDGTKYQLKGCGLHLAEQDFGDIVFDSYSDAKKVLDQIWSSMNISDRYKEQI